MDDHATEAELEAGLDTEFEQLLRGADLRVTRPRLAVLRAVRRQKRRNCTAAACRP